QRREEYVDRVGSRLEQLHVLLEQIEERILDVTKERAGFEAQEKRLQGLMNQFNESFEQGEVQLASVREAQRTIEQVTEFLAKLDEGLKDLQAGESKVDELRLRMREQEEKIEGVSVMAANLQTHIENLNQEEERISQIEKRISALDRDSSSLEEGIEELIQNKAEVGAAQEELSTLKLGVREIHTNIRELVNDRQTLHEIELQIDELRDIFQQVEERGAGVAQQMDKVAEVEERVKDLGLLSEDVRAKYESLVVEKDVLDRANVRISELRAVLQEAERRVDLT
ncbi:MAG TPA: hypothetical protein DDZ83_15270, partial [Nitrospinae bacterium]|nr:hypothetical protein [Nitrospinota bacterium]